MCEIKFPYEVDHVSIYKRSNRSDNDDPWTAAFRHPLRDKRVTRSLGANVEVAWKKAKKISRWISRVMSGEYDQVKARRAWAAKVDAKVLVKKYAKALRSRGVTREHRRQFSRRTLRVITRAKARTISGLTPSRVDQAIIGMRDLTKTKPRPLLGAVTRNGYATAITCFAQWCKEESYVAENWLENRITRWNPKEDPQHPRRIITEVELARLILAAAGAVEILGVSGSERALIYRTCIATALRADELRTLTVGSLVLDGIEPGMHVEVRYAKNRHKAFQLISPELADMLRAHVAGRRADEPVFNIPRQTAEMLRTDLALAGIPYQLNGEFFDFHALRFQSGSMMAASEPNLKVVQEHMRHSTITLTMDRYVKAQMHDRQSAVNRLPMFPAAPPEAQEQRATGTDGQREALPLRLGYLQPPKKGGRSGSNKNSGEGLRIANPLFVGSNPTSAFPSNPLAISPSDPPPPTSEAGGVDFGSALAAPEPDQRAANPSDLPSIEQLKAWIAEHERRAREGK